MYIGGRLKQKVSQVTDMAEKGNQEPMADQVITMEPELSLCSFVQCCSHLKIFRISGFSGNLYS